ncbi:MAG TPA: hypothetical protein PK528_12280 [Syntrophorhabdus sp.]|nr:hypothetical protein [Syntrophorhabdus sp.]
MKLQDVFKNKHDIVMDVIHNSEKSSKGIEELWETILHRAFTGDLTAKWHEAHMKELLQEMEEQIKAFEATKYSKGSMV